MTVASSRDFLFCPLTGTLLELDAASGLAKCPVCNWTKSLAELEDTTTTSKIDMEDFRRRHKLEPIVKDDQQKEEGGFEKQQRATIDETCAKCGHQGLEYYTMQLRSADEGQTVFYECPSCGERTRQNN